MAGSGHPEPANKRPADRHTKVDLRRRPRPDPSCGNCQGRDCMGCVFREYDHTCEDDCPMCCTGPYPEHVVRIWRDDTAPRGHPMAWRARCRCMDARSHFTPAWAGHSHARAMHLAELHVTDPHDDDWLILTDRAARR